MPRLRRAFLAQERFRRDTAAPFVDGSGATVLAASGEPRFDHDPDTLEPVGLLVTPRDGAVAADHVSSRDTAWAYEAVGQVCTVFHWFRPLGGQLQRLAYHTRDPAALVEALKRKAGWTRRIKVLTRAKAANAEGFITWKHEDWLLAEGGELLVGPDGKLDLGDGGHLLTDPHP